jgi:L-ascorbate metabolism protein UlaG (beta-lactamase superfamily)
MASGATPAASRLGLDFIGHSAVVIELDGVRILTDPVTRARVGPLRRVEPVPARDRLRDIDAVLISHLHWDHLDVPSLRDLGRDIPMFVPAGSGAWMRAAGFADVRELAVGESASVGSVVVRAVPAIHSGYRPPLGPTAPPLGFVVRGSRSIYFAGDTDLFEGMGEFGEPIDVALIPVWGWGPTLGRGLHLDPLRAARALRLIRPRAAVPIHWGTYWPHALGRVFPERLVEPPAALVEYASELAPDVRMLPTAVGDVVEWAP